MARKSSNTLTPREYQKRSDLCKLWSLACIGKSQAQIAYEMQKDPAWVSRSLKEINADFSKAFTTPDESRLIEEKLLKLRTLYSEAMNTALISSGHTRISALRLAAEISQQETSFHLSIGLVHKAPSDVRVAGKFGVANMPTMEDLRNEFQDGDIEYMMLQMANATLKKMGMPEIEIPSPQEFLQLGSKSQSQEE